MSAWVKEIRTVRGQFILLGVTFLGAIVLALLALLFRNRVFEYYVREKYPDLQESNLVRIEKLAAPRIEPERLDTLLKELDKGNNLEQVYGAWIEDPSKDPDSLLARRLGTEEADWLLERLRRTLIAGNPSQRGRALDWLLDLPADKRENVVALVRFARTRALRRHEEDLLEKADAVLEKLSPPNGAP